eukprot:1136509-Pelagomonas_calceolata.AAC.2
MWALLLASGGLGYATTRKLAENGAQVFMVSRSLANGKAAAAKMEAECGMPLQLHVLECDFRELRCALLEVLRKRAMDLCNWFVFAMRNVVRLINDFHEVCKEPLHIFVAMAGVGDWDENCYPWHNVFSTREGNAKDNATGTGRLSNKAQASGKTEESLSNSCEQ